MMTGINLWDIYNADVKFNETDSKSKIRPVIIIDEINNIYCSLKITSTKRTGLEEYTIKYWKEAGLDKESNIRLSKFFTFTKHQLLNKRGVLKLLDRKLLIKQLKDFTLTYNTYYSRDIISKLEKRIDENL